MHAISERDRPAHQAATAESELEHLAEVVEHAAHLLPAQGPITVFIHHNTLHALEDLPFYEAVKKGAAIFGCHPYLTEDRYRQELARGRIRFTELHEVLEQDLGERAKDRIPFFGTRLDLRLAMLQYPLRTGPTEELVWFVAEMNAMSKVRAEVSSAVRARLIAETRRWVIRDLRGVYDPQANGQGATIKAPELGSSLSELLRRFGLSSLENWEDDDWERFTLQALWRVCCDGVRDLPPFTSPPHGALRHRDLLFEATGFDSDVLVHELLIRFCAAYLDQGQANWSLPDREKGFFKAFCGLYRGAGDPPDRWLKGLSAELGRIEDSGMTPLESIRESLTALGVARHEWGDFLSATFLALRGWGGMIRQVETRGDRVVHPVPPGSLVEFLAVRLILDRLALAFTAKNALDIEGPVREFWRLARGQYDPHWPPSVEQRAFLVFQLSQVLGLSPDVMSKLTKADWRLLLEEIETFNSLERRRIFHLAYERRFYTQALDALALHAPQAVPSPAAPRFQALFCIDEREESIRRHLEEVEPNCATYGTAGFFSIAMYYRGAADAHFVPLCPPVIKPSRWVVEQAVEDRGNSGSRRARARRTIGLLTHRFHKGSRSFAAGAVLSAAVGVLASIPLMARTLFPRLTARVRNTFGRIVETPPKTRLTIERTGADAGQKEGEIGFAVGEMMDITEKVLREIGLTSGFSRLVLILGHGSSSMNNPHESAYDCGACGGARGGPNARALAQMLRDPRVREALILRGIDLPETTVFIGGMHNTSTDEVTFFDTDLVPQSHVEEFKAVRATVEVACERNSHERSRRFMSAPLTQSFTAAKQGVEARSEDLAQVRPEWCHMTNGMCVVGRRELTRGLYLDRRSFLVTYDPTQDDDGKSILFRILSAVFPVCAGISLEYYFSSVDNQGWGCGTKLPHNISALLGVMDGAASDLRTGLSLQMIEYHEPVRLLFVIETTAEVMREMMSLNETVGRLCKNAWVRLALIHPETRALSVFEDGEFKAYTPKADGLPRAPSSVDWYRGWRDHLEFAEVGA